MSSRHRDRESHHRRSRSRSPPPRHRDHREEDRERRPPRHHQNQRHHDEDRGRDRDSPPGDFKIRIKPEHKYKDPSPTRRDRESSNWNWGTGRDRRHGDRDHDTHLVPRPTSGDPEDTNKPPVEPEKPNFGLSGKLTEETNTFKGIVIKYSEPPEARKPQKIRWRLYPFKGQEALPVMYIHRQSAYLLGRERKIADIPIDHPSCSKQHAAIQFRLLPYERSDGSMGRRIRPYIIDLESANGTFVNGKQIEAKRYVELFEKDILKFGFSSREYVLLHEGSKDEDDDGEYSSAAEENPEGEAEKNPPAPVKISKAKKDKKMKKKKKKHRRNSSSSESSDSESSESESKVSSSSKKKHKR